MSMLGQPIRGVTVTVLAAALLAVGAAAGDEQTDRGFRGETTVNVIEVPVWVFDRATGRTVTGLARCDFRVREGSREQEISHFREVVRDSSRSSENRADVDSEPVELIYFLDLYLMVDRDKRRAVDGLRRRYAGGISDGEWITIVSFDGRLRSHVERTDDRREVREALDEVAQIPAQGVHHLLSFSGQPTGAGAPDGSRLRASESRQHSMEFLHDLRQHVDRVGSAISATVARFAGVNGRRVLVAISSGHPGTEWSPAYSPEDFFREGEDQQVRGMWRRVGLDAAGHDFTIFAIDPSDRLDDDYSPVAAGFDLIERARLQGASTPRGDNFSANPGAFRDAAPLSSGTLLGWLDRSREQLLLSTAEMTGGVALVEADVGRAVESVTRSLQHYYSLAYVADHAGDGKVHDIEVALSGHPSYGLGYRRSYVDQPQEVQDARRLKSQMMFGNDQNPLGVRVAVLDVTRHRGKRNRVSLDIRIPYGLIDMVPRGDDYWGNVLITFFNQGDTNDASRLWSREQPITVEADRYRGAVATGYFSFKTVLEIAGGKQEIYVGVQDLLGGNTSLVPQHFDY
jgi:VWFA-related protein